MKPSEHVHDQTGYFRFSCFSVYILPSLLRLLINLYEIGWKTTHFQMTRNFQLWKEIERRNWREFMKKQINWIGCVIASEALPQVTEYHVIRQSATNHLEMSWFSQWKCGKSLVRLESILPLCMYRVSSWERPILSI